MAVVARPLANPAAGRAMMRLVVLAVLLVAASAEALDVNVETYREARRSGALGAVTGRVYAEQRSLKAAPKPLTGTTITLMPRSDALLTRLARLKDQSRESSVAFTAAAPGMRKAQQEYERELLQAGAPDLNPLVLVDAEGGFKIGDVPAGAWILLAWSSVPVDVSTPKTKTKERGLYQPQPRLHGFQSVTVWMRELTVSGGAPTTVDLTDRNGWFRGVIEERLLDAGR
jgi:hypothetical protein